jgi:hypothetical protein
VSDEGPPIGSVWQMRWGDRFIVRRVIRWWLNGRVVMAEFERLDPGPHGNTRGAREMRPAGPVLRRSERIR